MPQLPPKADRVFHKKTMLLAALLSDAKWKPTVPKTMFLLKRKVNKRPWYFIGLADVAAGILQNLPDVRVSEYFSLFGIGLA